MMPKIDWSKVKTRIPGGDLSIPWISPTWSIKDIKPWVSFDLKPKCECGKDKHNFFTHSTWCPKF